MPEPTKSNKPATRAKKAEVVTTAVVPAAPTQMAAQFLSKIADAAANPEVDIEKMERLLVIQRELLHDQRVAAYKAAKAKLQGEIPVLRPRGERIVKDEVHNRYALMEDIHEVVWPLMAKHGFSFDWTEEEVAANGRTYIGVLSHEDGHEVSKKITLALDTGGSKNTTQAAGSTASYAQRYLLKMHLNLVTKGEDTDGEVEKADPEQTHANNAEKSAEIDPKLIPMSWQQAFKEQAHSHGIRMEAAINKMRSVIEYANEHEDDFCNDDGEPTFTAKQTWVKNALKKQVEKWQAAKAKKEAKPETQPEPEPEAQPEPEPEEPRAPRAQTKGPQKVTKEDFARSPFLADEDDGPPADEKPEEPTETPKPAENQEDFWASLGDD